VILSITSKANTIYEYFVLLGGFAGKTGVGVLADGMLDISW